MSPSKFHQVGQPEVNFTTPLENINRKQSHRTAQNRMESLGVPAFTCWVYQNGATIIHKNPVSNKRASLKKWLIIIYFFLPQQEN